MSKQPGEQIVFVVDNEVIISTTLGMILRHEGYDSRSFSQPEEAIEAAKVDSPDLLVTDLSMPGMTGLQLAYRMRQICPRCRILLFSGQTSMSDLIERAKDDGIPIDHFLMKPVHPKVLLEKVEEIMNDKSMASARASNLRNGRNRLVHSNLHPYLYVDTEERSSLKSSKLAERGS